MKLNQENMNQVVDRCVFFVVNKEPFVLIELDKSFLFTKLFAPYNNKYRGKKRDVVIQAAMRDHTVYSVTSMSDMTSIINESA